MKKTKPILALLAALALLFAAACDQGLSPSSPNLGEYKDAKTNLKYTNNVITGDDYFPDITAVEPLNGGETDPKDKRSLLKLDFTDAVSAAKNAGVTLDILKGTAEEVEAKIKAAIIFQGVLYRDITGITDGTVLANANFPPYNDYPTLAASSVTVDRETVYVQLPDLGDYNAVRAYIKASEYKISGNAIDTDGNGKGGESPYDDHYDATHLFNVTQNKRSNTAIYKNRPKNPAAFALGPFNRHTSTTKANYYLAAYYGPHATYDTESYAGLSEYIKLQVWKAAEKKWEDSSIVGAYATSGDFAGYFYFSISVLPNAYDKYRIIATNLHNFATAKEIQGFTRRFAEYPTISNALAPEAFSQNVIAPNTPVTVKDGTMVLGELLVYGSDYRDSHFTGSNTYTDLFSVIAVETDEAGKNAMIIADVNTTTRGTLGNLGLAKPLPVIADFNKNFKLAYLLYSTDNIQDAGAVVDYIGIKDAKVRDKPGAVKHATTGEMKQQLVLTLDPGYKWVNGRAIYIFAREGIKYAGDDVLVLPDTTRRKSGSLGNANGAINIDGYWDWGSYGSFTQDIDDEKAGSNNSDIGANPDYQGTYSGKIKATFHIDDDGVPGNDEDDDDDTMNPDDPKVVEYDRLAFSISTIRLSQSQPKEDEKYPTRVFSFFDLGSGGRLIDNERQVSVGAWKYITYTDTLGGIYRNVGVVFEYNNGFDTPKRYLALGVVAVSNVKTSYDQSYSCSGFSKIDLTSIDESVFSTAFSDYNEFFKKL
jgi:hypothetical protein